MAYSIELFAREPINFDRERLLAAMRSRLGNVDSPEPKSEGATQMFLLNDHIAHFTDGSIPAQLVLLPASGGPDPEKYTEALQQSWSVRNAAEVLETCEHSCLFSDMMSAALPQQTRRHMLRSAVTGDDIDMVDVSRTPLRIEPGDYVILASDGLQTLETSEIERVVTAYAADGPQAVANALIRAVEAVRDPHQDNATVVAVRALQAPAAS